MTTARKKIIVYGLASSQDGKIRYVGQTSKSVRERWRGHTKEKHNTHKNRWVQSVLSSGHKIITFVLEQDAVWSETEIRLIAWYRKHGADLTNSTDGGDGVLNPSKEVRAKISAAIKGNVVITPEQRAKMVAGLRAREFSAEHKAINAAVCRARNATAEQRAAVSRAKKGRPLSAEHRKKNGDARRGTKRSEDAKRKTSDSVKKSWATPERRAKQTIAFARRFSGMLINEHGV